MTGIPPEHVFDLLAALDAAEQRLKTAENALEQIDEMSIGGGGGLLTAVNVTACAALTAIRPNPKP